MWSIAIYVTPARNSCRSEPGPVSKTRYLSFIFTRVHGYALVFEGIPVPEPIIVSSIFYNFIPISAPSDCLKRCAAFHRIANRINFWNKAFNGFCKCIIRLMERGNDDIVKTFEFLVCLSAAADDYIMASNFRHLCVDV